MYKIKSTTYPTRFSNYGEMEDRANELGQPLEKRGYSKCFVCGHKFGRGEDVYLAHVVNHKNVFLCWKCGKRVAEEE